MDQHAVTHLSVTANTEPPRFRLEIEESSWLKLNGSSLQHIYQAVIFDWILGYS